MSREGCRHCSEGLTTIAHTQLTREGRGQFFRAPRVTRLDGSSYQPVITVKAACNCASGRVVEAGKVLASRKVVAWCEGNGLVFGSGYSVDPSAMDIRAMQQEQPAGYEPEPVGEPLMEDDEACVRREDDRLAREW